MQGLCSLYLGRVSALQLWCAARLHARGRRAPPARHGLARRALASGPARRARLPAQLTEPELFQRGKLLGPRRLSAGEIFEGVPPAWGNAFHLIESVAEAEALVERRARDGVFEIKLYPTLSRKLQQAVSAKARTSGVRVTSHVANLQGAHASGRSRSRARGGGADPRRLGLQPGQRAGRALDALGDGVARTRRPRAARSAALRDRALGALCRARRSGRHPRGCRRGPGPPGGESTRGHPRPGPCSVSSSEDAGWRTKGDRRGF